MALPSRTAEGVVMATSLPQSLAVLVLTTLLLQAARGQEIAQRRVVKEGDNVTLQWNLQIQPGDRVMLDVTNLIVWVTLTGRVSIPASLSQSVQATVGPGMSGLTVTLLNINASLSGVYALIHYGQELQKQLVIVQVKPDQPTIKAFGGPFVVGRERTFACNSKSNSQPSNHSLPLTFTWSVTPPGGRQEGGNYTITVPPQDRKTMFSFRCQAKELELESDYSDTLSLSPQYGPQDMEVTSSPAASSQRKVTVKEGQPMTLTCSVDCQPACTVQWKDRKMAVLPDSQTSNVRNGRTFSVASTGRSHYGVFKCSVSNTYGTDEKNLTVDVQYEASITSLMVNGQAFRDRYISLAVAENSAVNLDLVVDSNPAPTVQGARKDWGSEQYGAPTAITLQGPEVQSLDQVQQHLYRGRWSIAKAACSDTKDYIMEARNTFQENFGSHVRVNLSVNCSPRPTTPPAETIGVDLGTHQTVEVNITAFPRDLTFVSLHCDNRRVTPQPQLKTHLLPEPWKMRVSFNVTVQSQTDYGTYIARFANAHGDMNVTFSVRARGKPSPVEALQTTSITSTGVTLTWEAGFDGGLPQTFSVDYRPHGSQDWITAVTSISGSPATVDNLQPGTTFHFRVLSHNQLGISLSMEVEATTVTPSSNLGLIIGIVCGVAVLIAIVIGLILTLRKKRPEPETEDTHYAVLDSRTRHPPGEAACQELNTFEVVQ